METRNKDAANSQELPEEETAIDAAPQESAEEAAAETSEAPAEAHAEPTAEEALAAQLEQAQKDLAAEKDKYLRLLAEYDNYRKRSARERDSIYADVRADTLLKLLPVYDNLDRALQQTTADEAYRKGVEMTMNQFLDALKALGVTPIEAVGQTFDPAVHNAVMAVEDPEKGEKEIVQEFQKGFKMGERVIRFSMVQVAN